MFASKILWIVILVAIIGLGIFLGIKKGRKGVGFVSTYIFLSTVLFLAVLALSSNDLEKKILKKNGTGKANTVETGTESEPEEDETSLTEETVGAEIISLGNIEPGSEDEEAFFANAGEIINDRITCEATSIGKKYGPENLLDNNEKTCWQYGAKEEEVEILDFFFDEPANIYYLAIRNGSWTSQKKYEQNARPATVEVSGMNEEQKLHMDLVDEFGKWQVYELHGFSDVEHLQFEISGVYEGTAFDDTAVADILFIQ